MKLNDIKKALYKEKPVARLLYFTAEYSLYYTDLSNGEEIGFKVPHNDLGDAKFYKEMDAKLLIR